MILTNLSTMDSVYQSSDADSAKKASNSAAYEMIPLADDFEPTSLDGECVYYDGPSESGPLSVR